MADSFTTDPIPHNPRRPWVIWLLILGGILLLVLFKERMEQPVELISQHRFEELVNSDRIAKAAISYDNQSPLNEVVGVYFEDRNGTKVEVPFRTRVRLTGALEEKLLNLPQFEPRQPNTVLMSVVVSVLPFLIIAALIWFFFIRQIKRVTRTSPSAADTQAKSAEQQARFDRILDKWEEQTRRMDGVLDKLERNAKQS
jgi:ATP-dependent Zn protease